MRSAFLCLLFLLPLCAQNFNDVSVERIASGFRFTEGPALAPDGTLLFSDVPNNRIHQIVPGKGLSVYREASNGANGNTFDDRGRLYSCESVSRRVTRTSKDGTIEVLAERFEGKRLNAPNDIVVRRDGHVYFTDPAYGNQQEGRELDFFGVYHLTPKGELSLVARMDQRPNGITLSPNERILYVAGADERVIRAYDLDRSGKATNPRIVISGIDGVPDGIRTDSNGNIYIACKGLAIYSPEGKLLRMIEMAETPTNVAVSERGEWTLYVTAPRAVYRVKQGKPVAGQPK